MKNTQYPTKISSELQDTLRQDEGIKTIYFDKKGNHFFNVHELLINKDTKERALFTRGKYSHTQVIPGSWNVEKITERVSVGIPGCEVVNSMTRDEILKYDTEKPKSEKKTEEVSDKKEEKKAPTPAPKKED